MNKIKYDIWPDILLTFIYLYINYLLKIISTEALCHAMAEATYNTFDNWIINTGR